MYERFWGSSLQMDWDLTGISMSCRDGVMKSLPLTKIAFALQRRLAIGARVCTLIASRPCVAWLLFFYFFVVLSWVFACLARACVRARQWRGRSPSANQRGGTDASACEKVEK